jgi:hypothetical protein
LICVLLGFYLNKYSDETRILAGTLGGVLFYMIFLLALMLGPTRPYMPSPGSIAFLAFLISYVFLGGFQGIVVSLLLYLAARFYERYFGGQLLETNKDNSAGNAKMNTRTRSAQGETESGRSETDRIANLQ